MKTQTGLRGTGSLQEEEVPLLYEDIPKLEWSTEGGKIITYKGSKLPFDFLQNPANNTVLDMAMHLIDSDEEA